MTSPTAEDLATIDALLALNEQEYADRVWDYVFNPDRAGNRVFGAPALAQHTLIALAQLIDRENQAINTARGKPATDRHYRCRTRLRGYRKQLQSRLITSTSRRRAERILGHIMYEDVAAVEHALRAGESDQAAELAVCCRLARPVPAPPVPADAGQPDAEELTAADAREIDVLVEMDDEEFTSVLTGWVFAPDRSGNRVFTSPALVNRTYTTLMHLIKVENHAIASSRSLKSRERHERRRTRLAAYLKQVQAALPAELTVRRRAEQIIARVMADTLAELIQDLEAGKTAAQAERAARQRLGLPFKPAPKRGRK
ncbi:hypothetical protein ACFY05_32090 [Microtetraspora fusca]|uniref:Uncharacterized protein n=1 Tax=Microtetraspora fusca TaxID=1997 RepID=A0ABW6VDX5_MICFU